MSESGTPHPDSVNNLPVAAFALLLGAYATKVVRDRSAVLAEWRYPVKSAFTATIPIASLVASVALLQPED